MVFLPRLTTAVPAPLVAILLLTAVAAVWGTRWRWHRSASSSR